MPGPPPKPAGMRQRRNVVVGAARLPAEGTALPAVPAPALPDRPCLALLHEEHSEQCALCDGTNVRPWHQLVLDWWRDVWASPMAHEFLKSDVHGLFILAELRDQFWTTGEKELAGEIRLQEQRFGLSSLDRRRLQWEVERVEQAQKRGRPPGPPKKIPTKDPRAFLKAVK